MDTSTAAHMVNGRRLGVNAMFRRVTTDTRALQIGDLFVALAGERFDGHDFVAQALTTGASAAMVDDTQAAKFRGSLVAVADTRAALGALAAQWRARFDIPVVVITGSNGKTTVKEMAAAILRAQFGDSAVLATRGNLNNDIGLPQTLLELRSTHRVAVVELGVNHRGETRELAAIARPTVALINNAQREHQEFMQSVAEVAAEHADVIFALRPGGTVVLNADDPYCEVWRGAAQRGEARVVTFALDTAADVRAVVALHADGSDITISAGGAPMCVRIVAPGAAMARNALAATAVAMSAGAGMAAVARGLATFRPVKGRLATRHAPEGATIIDDTYNANPDSVREAIAVLARAAAPRWLVLGDMGEVGTQGPGFHREIGEHARAAGIERLFAAGTLARDAVLAFGAQGAHFDDVDALLAALPRTLPATATVLVKGSRFMRMERVVDALCAPPDPAGDH
ncbi:MAG: UDP-N-acetylmuramoyl-tripeptide--D-alanyl-D-alanine ligase [Betaproteobacteria bacterium]